MSDAVTLPDWLVLFVGRLTLENEGMRQALAALQAQQAPPEQPADSS